MKEENQANHFRKIPSGFGFQPSPESFRRDEKSGRVPTQQRPTCPECPDPRVFSSVLHAFVIRNREAEFAYFLGDPKPNGPVNWRKRRIRCRMGPCGAAYTICQRAAACSMEKPQSYNTCRMLGITAQFRIAALLSTMWGADFETQVLAPQLDQTNPSPETVRSPVRVKITLE